MAAFGGAAAPAVAAAPRLGFRRRSHKSAEKRWVLVSALAVCAALGAQVPAFLAVGQPSPAAGAQRLPARGLRGSAESSVPPRLAKASALALASLAAVVSGALARGVTGRRDKLRVVVNAAGRGSTAPASNALAHGVATPGGVARCGRVARRFFGGGDDDPLEKCTAVRLQVGLQYSKQLLSTLNKLSETADSSTDEGLHQLLLDVVLAIRRAEPSWRYASLDRVVFGSDDPAREAGSTLQRWGVEAQSKFGGDDDMYATMDTKAPSGVTEYIVITMLVSAYGVLLKDDAKVRKSADVREILDVLCGVQVDELTQLDVQWIPEEDGDRFGAMEVTMKFPELVTL